MAHITYEEIENILTYKFSFIHDEDLRKDFWFENRWELQHKKEQPDAKEMEQFILETAFIRELIQMLINQKLIDTEAETKRFDDGTVCTLITLKGIRGVSNNEK